MFLIRFMQENYHSCDVIFSLFDFTRQGDEQNVYRRWLDHLSFLSNMATDRKMDWDYYFFYLMIIDAF